MHAVVRTSSLQPHACISRRDFLWQLGGGLGGDRAGATCSAASGLLPRPRPRDVRNGSPHFPAQAKRVVQLFMSGAASQCDTFDYKPRLIERHGQKWDPGEKVELFQSQPGHDAEEPVGVAAVRPVRQVGQRLRRPAGGRASTTSRSSTTWSASPTSTARPRSCRRPGSSCPGSPASGRGSATASGSLSDNLPTFVVLPDPRGFAPNGPKNWGAGFLPAEHQGTMIRPGAPNPIADLFPPDGTRTSTRESERGRCSLR